MSFSEVSIFLDFGSTFLVKFNKQLLMFQNLFQELFSSLSSSGLLTITHLLFELLDGTSFFLGRLSPYTSTFVKISIDQLMLVKIVASRLSQ